MLSANKEKLQSFYMGQNQFVIPFFQRAYVWKADNWSELWENILEEYNEFKNGNIKSEHFIGTIIIKQRESEKVGSLEYDLIDGQQRLTTICLLLRAFYDVSDDINIKNWIQGLFVFKDSYGNDNIRIINSKIDRDYFQALLLNKDNNTDLWAKYSDTKIEVFERDTELMNKVQAAYIYFRKRIELEADKSDLRTYIQVVLEKLPVIHMALAKEDDVQQIFDTINSLGVKLTTAELLKNFLYSSPKVAEYYNDYWYSIFETDEDAIEFWNRDRTSGRIKRTTVELFLYSYLVIIKESNVKLESLFKEFKNHLKNKTQDELIDFAKDIFDFASVYQDLPDGENLAEINFDEHDKRFFHVIREFDINTIFPLVLYIYKVVNDQNERIQILRVLESYVSRRTICKLTTKNYNNLFISILGELKKKEKVNAIALSEILCKYTEPTNRFPNDEELQKAFHSTYLYNQYSREILYCIALFNLNHKFTDNPKLNINGFSVEHIMPKKWRNNWNHLTEEITENVRDSKLLTLGNLTLIKGRLNSSMRDSAWDKKRAALRKYSTLKQTIDYLDIKEWNEAEISSRANHLFKSALQIWMR
ncbi:MAG: DUF262 domain-containing protein [Marinilabiliaceae bacterium]|nr:DUF262 domain-containing protein [Marinilabiliaceae bacterium]